MAGGAKTLRDALLPVADTLRGIPGRFGVRLYTVTVHARSFSGGRPGVGTVTQVDTGLKVDLGVYPVKVEQLTQQEIVASAGLYQSNDIRVGPITPPYTGSAADNDAISVWLPNASPGTEIRFKVIGPGMPPGGPLYRMVSHDFTKPFRYTFVLRATGEVSQL